MIEPLLPPVSSSRVRQGIWLDNFVVGDDVAEALKLAESTWRPKLEAWEAVAAAEKRQKEQDTVNQERCD